MDIRGVCVPRAVCSYVKREVMIRMGVQEEHRSKICHLIDNKFLVSNLCLEHFVIEMLDFYKADKVFIKIESGFIRFISLGISSDKKWAF